MMLRRPTTVAIASAAVTLMLGSSFGMTAATQIKQLEAALDSFRADNGSYPTTEESLAALLSPPERVVRTYRAGGYLGSGRVPPDPWGNPYQYRLPGEHHPEGFDLWSFGADGRLGGAGHDADIGNWTGGVEEHQRLHARAALLTSFGPGACLALAVGLPVYLAWSTIRARRGLRWSRALLGRPLVAFLTIVILGTLLGSATFGRIY
jgi:general secretion pathway protein G